MKVKICGIKRIEDALKAVEYGADAIGLLVNVSSKNAVDKLTAKQIVQKIPPTCSAVMVVTITDSEEIIRLAKYIGVTTVQLHGDSSPEDIAGIKNGIKNVNLIKTIHVTDLKSIDKCKNYYNCADAILLDTSNKFTGVVGGTGLAHDWNISKKIVEECPIPVVLAGGLNPENIAEAIKIVKPYGVDVQSGVNGQDGFKDYEKMKEFIKRAKIN